MPRFVERVFAWLIDARPAGISRQVWDCFLVVLLIVAVTLPVVLYVWAMSLRGSLSAWSE